MCLEIFFVGEKEEEGLILLFVFLLRAPETGDYFGAFSRFCILLLKASYCISFCLGLPTCKMGLIPPTSLKSPGFKCTRGSGHSLGQVLD